MTQQLNRKAKLHFKNVPRECKYKTVPWLNLSGLWLEQAGFEIGDQIDISVSKDTLVITVASKAPKLKNYWED